MQNTLRKMRNLLLGTRGDQYIFSREKGAWTPLGALDVVDGEGEFIFSKVIPLGFTRLYLLFV